MLDCKTDPNGQRLGEVRPDPPGDAARNPEICDLVLGEEGLRVAMLLEGIHVTHGLGSVTTAHTEDDLQFLGDACRRVARRIGPYLA